MNWLLIVMFALPGQEPQAYIYGVYSGPKSCETRAAEINRVRIPAFTLHVAGCVPLGLARFSGDY